MSAPAIVVRDLGKRYRIGLAERRPESFLQAVAQTVARPLSYLRTKLRAQTEEETLWALRGLDLEVPQGEVLGVIGTNGSGKSTFLKILSRITQPTEGMADIRGRVGSLLEVGTGFHMELTGRENVYMNGAILGMRKREIDAKFDRIVDFAGVARMIDTPVKRYSSGMQVRLGFAVAAHLQPEVLLVDEVLAVGDAAFRRKCVGKIDDISREGRTVLFVSHSMDAVLALCSRVLWLDRGRPVRLGPPREVVGAYLAASYEQAQRPLAERTDRGGDGRARFVGVELQDAEGHPIRAIPLGSDLRVVAEYRSDLPELTHVAALVAFRDRFQRELLRLSTGQLGLSFDALPGRGRLECRIPRFPLAPGSYTIDLHLGVEDLPADQLDGAAEVEVVAGDFFRRGGDLTSLGAFLCDHEWRPRELADTGSA